MATKKNTGLGKGLGALLAEPSSIVHKIKSESIIRNKSSLIGEIYILN